MIEVLNDWCIRYTVPGDSFPVLEWDPECTYDFVAKRLVEIEPAWYPEVMWRRKGTDDWRRLVATEHPHAQEEGFPDPKGATS